MGFLPVIRCNNWSVLLSVFDQSSVINILDLTKLNSDLYLALHPAMDKGAGDQVSILIINPNSSTYMTEALKPLLQNLQHPNLRLDFYTAPPTAPRSINDAATSDASAQETLPDLLKFLGLSDTAHSLQQGRYSAYLIACYSAHPLTPILRARIQAPVLNIFEASVIYARSLRRPFGIVTTGKYWETALSGAMGDIRTDALGKDGENDEDSNFVGVRSTKLNASELHSTDRAEVDRKIIQASAELVRGGAQVVLLGCAGMSGMDHAVREGARMEGKEVEIVDGVRVGVQLLESWAESVITLDRNWRLLKGN
jgi:Asp/Glu/hydantoin racemase